MSRMASCRQYSPKCCLWLLLQRLLNALRHLEMTVDGRPDLFDERLQLSILRARDERVVDRIEHVLVKRDFILDVRAVELITAQAFETLFGLVCSALQGLAGCVVGRRETQFACERSGLLVHTVVVRNHFLPELPHL